MAEELTPDICVVGGGPGGVAAALAALAEGVPVILVEKGPMGGSDLAWGSIPSRALSAAAGVNELLRRAPALGVTGAPLQVDLAGVREHIDAVASAVAPNVSAERLTALGVRVIAAPARFVDRDTMMAGDLAIRARRTILAVGSVPAAPSDIPGLDGVEHMTVESGFDVTRKPDHLLVFGAGREGLEFAQAWNRLGIDATVIDRGAALPGDDPELAAVVVDRLKAEGIRVRTGVEIVSVARRRGGVRFTVSDPEGGDAAIDGSHLLVATGRRPNIDGLDLAAGGIQHDEAGIVVNANLRTTNRRVFAIGDAIAGPAHVARARHQAVRVVKSLLFRVPSAAETAAPPFVTFTDPALATVGLNETEARRRHGDKVRVLRHTFAENTRARIDRQPAGFIKVVVAPAGHVLGASIVGQDACEMIALWSLAVAQRLPIAAIAAMPAPYPTLAEISQQVAAGFFAANAAEGVGLTSPLRRRIIGLLRKFG